MNVRISRLLVAMWLVTTTQASFASVLYEQTLRGWGGGPASQHDPDISYPDIFKTFENFYLTGSSDVNRIEWVGSRQIHDQSVDDQIAGFLIQFWTDSAGPATLLASELVPGSANETLLAETNGYSVNTYSVNLSNVFRTNANVTYWLAIQAVMPVRTQWFWADGFGDGYLVQDGEGVRHFYYDQSTAFRLSGVQVPEPGTLALLWLGLTGLVLSRKRKAD